MDKSGAVNVGLVLAGGGARGAYHVGVLQCLNELGFVPNVIAGTSIGALNGAVLASVSSFSEAVSRLCTFWDRLGREKILKLRGSGTTLPSFFGSTELSGRIAENLNVSLSQSRASGSDSIFDITPIELIFDELINVNNLRGGIDLWVTVFRSVPVSGLIGRVLDYAMSFLSQDAEWLLAQSLADGKDIKDLLLASAAIPLVFPRRHLNGSHYVDGGLGDNLPVRAIATQNCDVIVVVHLEDGSALNRFDFAPSAVIEIRPRKKINTGFLGGIFDFSSQRIAMLREQGYNDACTIIGEVESIARLVRAGRDSSFALRHSTRRIIEDEPLT